MVTLVVQKAQKTIKHEFGDRFDLPWVIFLAFSSILVRFLPNKPFLRKGRGYYFFGQKGRVGTTFSAKFGPTMVLAALAASASSVDLRMSMNLCGMFVNQLSRLNVIARISEEQLQWKGYL